MMSNDKMREEFEAWLFEFLNDANMEDIVKARTVQDGQPIYLFEDAHEATMCITAMWVVWQASCAAHAVQGEQGTVWVLTSEWNLYDQMGEYFEAVFKDKPTKEQLLEVAPSIQDIPTPDPAQHVLNGGGRIDCEDEWYWLREVPLDN